MTQQHHQHPHQPERRAKRRADRTACSDCTTAAHATHLHRVHPICTTDQCRQGHRACPTPQACEVPEEAPGTPAEFTGLVLGALGVVVLLVLALISCAGA